MLDKNCPSQAKLSFNELPGGAIVVAADTHEVHTGGQIAEIKTGLVVS